MGTMTKNLTRLSAPSNFDCLVLGAGFLGLAAARELSLTGRRVLVVDPHDEPGAETSGRNSEVIHAGLYYAHGSLKARACVEGRDLLYSYCAARNVPVSKMGKLLVASSPSQLKELKALLAHAKGNGVTDLEEMGPADANRLEPAISCLAAVLSPSSGVVDTRALLRAMLEDVRENGGDALFGHAAVSGVLRGHRGAAASSAAPRHEVHVAPVSAAGPGATSSTPRTAGGAGEAFRLRPLEVVNAAGLWAQQVALSFQGLDPATVPPLYLAKGNYFRLRGPSPFQRLVYPLPSGDGGLGVHVTLDLAGRVRFGPDVQWLPAPRREDGFSPAGLLNYEVDESRKGAFVKAIQTYYPSLDPTTVEPAYSGIRPKLVPTGSGLSGDFSVQGPAETGVPGLVNLFGIESPGLTSCLSLARLVVRKLEGR